MPGPTKHAYASLEEVVQINAKFLKHLWSAQGAGFRTELLGAPTENDLRTILGRWGIQVDGSVRIMVVDLETAQVKTHGPINSQTDSFYTLVLPPAPLKYRPPPAQQPEVVQTYNDRQRLAAAYYHAVNDSYGM